MSCNSFICFGNATFARNISSEMVENFQIQIQRDLIGGYNVETKAFGRKLDEERSGHCCFRLQ